MKHKDNKMLIFFNDDDWLDNVLIEKIGLSKDNVDSQHSNYYHRKYYYRENVIICLRVGIASPRIYRGHRAAGIIIQKDIIDKYPESLNSLFKPSLNYTPRLYGYGKVLVE